MALVMDRHAGLFDVVKGSYVRISGIRLNLDEQTVSFSIQTYLSKRAREMEIMIEYCRQRSRDAALPIEPEAGQLEELGITRGDWDAWTTPGPWNYEELRWLEDHLFSLEGRPVQGIEITLPIPEGIPDTRFPDEIKAWLYDQVKQSNLQHAVIGGGDDRESVIKSMQDDVESSADVIQRYREEYPVFGK